MWILFFTGVSHRRQSAIDLLRVRRRIDDSAALFCSALEQGYPALLNDTHTPERSFSRTFIGLTPLVGGA